jgi:sugar fermentation stimulation protein A
MQIEEELLRGRLKRRYKRFLADVVLEDGSTETVHCPNPGRMTSCVEPDWEVLLSRSKNKARKLPLTLEMTHNGDSWIGVNTHRANSVVSEAILTGKIPELSDYDSLQREVSDGRSSRFDIFLPAKKPGLQPCFVEVKSVTLLCQNDVLAFPDAVTVRGKRHLEGLCELVTQGYRCVMFFLIQRSDGKVLRPAWDVDPAYCQALIESQERGVEILAYRAKLDPPVLVLDAPVPVLLKRE